MKLFKKFLINHNFSNIDFVNPFCSESFGWAPDGHPKVHLLILVFRRHLPNDIDIFLENVTFIIVQQILSKPDNFWGSLSLSCMQPVCIPCIEMTESIRFSKVL